MTSVRLPRWMGLDFKEKGRIRPTSLQLQLMCPGVSEAQMTLPAGAPVPAMHEWLEIYTANGSAGFYRVTCVVRTYTGETQVTLRHAIDTMADSHFDTAGDYEGTLAEYMADLITAQTARIGGTAPWQLGSVVGGTADYPVKVNYDRLSDALTALLENIPGTQLAYDFTTTPWTLSLVAQPQNVASEFRLGHNLSTLEVTYSDADLCTQLVLQVNAVDVESSTGMPDIVTPVQVTKTYNNATAQANWGVVQQYAAIDTHDDLTQQTLPEADAWASNYLAQRADPRVQIEIDGEELAAYTFETYDETKLGYLCRIALPDYDTYLNERVVNITYPDVIGTPTHITVSLANELPKVSGALKATIKAAEKASSTAASASRAANAAAGLSHWEAIVQDIKLANDATGITELYESGIVLDAQEGVTIYSLAQGFRSDYSAIKVNSEQIALRVRTGQVATQLSVECGNVSVSGGNLTVDGYVTAEGLVTTLTSYTGNISASGYVAGLYLSGGYVVLNGDSLSSHSITWIGGGLTMVASDGNLDLRHYHGLTASVDSGTGVVTLQQEAAQTTQPTPATFSIADTAFYQQAVSAAEASGWSGAANTVRINNSKTGAGDATITLTSGESVTVYSQVKANSSASIYTTVGTVTITAPTVTQRTATNAGTITLGSSDTGSSVSKTTTVTYDDSATTADVPVTINASSVYSAGQNSIKMSKSWSSSTVTVSRTTSSSGTINNISFSVSATAGITYNSSAHTYTASAQASADGAVRASDTATSGTDAYDAGVSDRTVNSWWAGASSFSLRNQTSRSFTTTITAQSPDGHQERWTYSFTVYKGD